MTSHSEVSALWDEVAQVWTKGIPQALWRRHSDAINAALLRRWLPLHGGERLLKTDLFDEAVGEGVLSAATARVDRVIGIDISRRIAFRAWERGQGALAAVVADVRQLPLASECLDAVVSLSTLDHFRERDDISVALRELCRVLRPGGVLVLTLDNSANPIIALRQAMPMQLLRHLGIIPYDIGATMGPWQLRKRLRALPLRVQEMAALLHCPRVLAVAQADRLQKTEEPRQQRFLNTLWRWERLGNLPTRWLTGHFVAVLATKQ